jgi:hypothetical protein
MNFSSEEIFFQFGQFDKFVSIRFHLHSDAFSKYNSVMGCFKYSLPERQLMQKLIEKNRIERTERFVRFEPSELSELNKYQRIELDKTGFNTSDIYSISSLNLPVENRFAKNDLKEIPNTLNVQFDFSDINICRLELLNLSNRLKRNFGLIPEELDKYFGYSLYFDPERISDEKLFELMDFEKGQLKDEVLYYKLKAEIYENKLIEFPKEFKELSKKIISYKAKVLRLELQKSSEKINKIGVKYKDSLYSIFGICVNFETESLIQREFPIWWDFERFIHIYLRHVKETKIGERFESKTIFQYKFKDIRRIIEIVLKSIYEEILIHFKDNPVKNFKRLGTRCVYFDGNYYRIEIEPNGRLINFHPLNDGFKDE